MRKILILLMFVFAACNSEKANPTATIVAPTATRAIGFDNLSIEPEARLAAEQHFEQLRQLHDQMETVWEDLGRGETAQCGVPYDTLSPEALPEGDALNAQLRLAAGQLLTAIELWQAECANPRPKVPQETIDQGILAVRGAGDALRQAETLLAAAN